MTRTLMNQAEADAVDNIDPRSQISQVGERIREIQATGLVVQRVDVTADASAGADFLVDYAMVLLDVLVRATATSGSGTLTLRRLTTAISSAVVCAVDEVLSRTTTITDAGQVLAVGETLNIIAAGAANRGEMFLVGYRV